MTINDQTTGNVPVNDQATREPVVLHDDTAAFKDHTATQQLDTTSLQNHTTTAIKDGGFSITRPPASCESADFSITKPPAKYF